MNLNYKQLPIKVHYFFFMAAMGPILPFLPVYGKQLGVSPMVMGSITAVLPILFLIAKPVVGFLVDYFRAWRKAIFIGLLSGTTICFVLLEFLPAPYNSNLSDFTFKNVSCFSLKNCGSEVGVLRNTSSRESLMRCHWTCNDNDTFVSLLPLEKFDKSKKKFLNSTCLTNSYNIVQNCSENENCEVFCQPDEGKNYSLYTSITFWGFVLLMSLGNIGFNVSNCISDAICFDVLGEGGQMGYGRQRLWGTIGFGITAFLAGYAIDRWSEGMAIKDYTPAFMLVLFFSIFDVFSCTKLELPIMSGSTNLMKDVYELMKLKPIVIFLCFATLAGIFDSFIIYFLFWYVEDLAELTNSMSHIKLIQGLIVTGETLGGELLFFSLSGKILTKFGYGYTLTSCFAFYAIRLALISFVPNPWWIIVVELFMQGPTYALCYTTIVAFASEISPPGTSATVQGIVAGMDDGFGFAIGSLIGGILYKKFGGMITLRIFASTAMVTSVMYFILFTTYLKKTMPDPGKNVHWKPPKAAAKECIVAE